MSERPNHNTGDDPARPAPGNSPTGGKATALPVSLVRVVEGLPADCAMGLGKFRFFWLTPGVALRLAANRSFGNRLVLSGAPNPLQATAAAPVSSTLV